MQFEHELPPQILQKIRAAIEQNVSELNSARTDKPISTIAWLSRNLLELVIWSEYCTQSEENAVQFMLDASRDGLDAINIPEEILPVKNTQSIREDLIEKAHKDGFDIEESYMRVANIAKKLGKGDMFKHLNKTLSKFAHPTALSIMGNAQAEQLLRDSFYNIGIYLSTVAIELLSSGQNNSSAKGSTAV